MSVVDIPNALIQTKVESVKDIETIKVCGELVDALLEISPEVYGPYVTKYKKGNKVLILRCKNAIYGTMVASLLYYMKFFVANRKVDGKQQTLCWHVDDCKIIHVDSKVSDELIEILRQEYESILEDGTVKMTVHRGKVHKYLRMTLDSLKKGVCQVTMFDYIKETLEAFDKMDPKAKGTNNSAAPAKFFTVR